MARFRVLGPPDAGMGVSYRGLDREVPLVQEHLGLSHPANQMLLAVLKDHEIPGPIPDLDVARALAEAFRSDTGLGAFEIVEVTQQGDWPTAGSKLLGYDVTFKDGSSSLLVQALLWTDPRETNSEEADLQVTFLRRRFAGRLNENLLFDTEADAAEFLNAAMELGPWEGPGIEWEVVGVWSVPDTPSADDSNSAHTGSGAAG